MATPKQEEDDDSDISENIFLECITLSDHSAVI